MSNWFKGLVAFVVIIAFFLIVKENFFENPSSIVSDQLKALRKKKFYAAYHEYFSEDFKKKNSLEEFTRFIKIHPVLNNNQKITIETSEVDGDFATVKGILISDGIQRLKGQYHLEKKMGQWKIIGINLQPVEDPIDLQRNILQIVNMIDEQLTQLKQNNISQAYYGYASRDFMTETPEVTFTEFILKHPMLNNFQKKTFKGKKIEDGFGLVTVNLESAQYGSYDLKYKLIREGDEWKILSLQVIIPKEKSEEFVGVNQEAMVKPVVNFLEAVSSRNIEDSYYAMSSEFKKERSLKDYLAMVAKNSIIENHSLIDIDTGTIVNNVGYIKATLHSENGVVVLEFQLKYENNLWHIIDVNVIQNQLTALLESEQKEVGVDYHNNTNSNNRMVFTDVVVGTHVDANHQVIEPLTEIPSINDQLYFNVFVNNGKEYAPVTMELWHVGQEISTPLMSTALEESGDSVLTFVYAAPKNGWPPGEYRAEVTSKFAAKVEFSFLISAGL